jgi:hypothetical protein
MSVAEARARSERSGAAFGNGAPAGSVKTRDTTLHLPHAQIQCRVYNPVVDATALSSAMLMCVVAA